MRRYEYKGSEGPRKLECVNLASNPPLGAGEVRVRVRAASLNYRDLLILGGLYPVGVLPDVVPLSDGAGDIVAVGEGVTHLKPGDRVASAFFPDWAGGDVCAQRAARTLGGSVHGMLAEEVVLPASAVLPFPDHLSYEEAATLPCAGLTAWNALVEVGRIKAGDVVLLQGTGGVSTFALQFAKLMGATVIQTSGSDAKLAKARALGADHLINYNNSPDWHTDALRLTNGRGVDLVVEVGGAGTLERSLSAVRVGGTVATIGLVSGVGQINPLLLIRGISRLIGIMVGSHDMYRDMCQAMTQCKMTPVISERFTFDTVPAAYERFRAGVFGKLVITI